MQLFPVKMSVHSWLGRNTTYGRYSTMTPTTEAIISGWLGELSGRPERRRRRWHRKLGDFWLKCSRCDLFNNKNIIFIRSGR
jgi:hypothetical protein